MKPAGPSIFDLSHSEKLQLVEDLWDDLAGMPEAVPVHDWQKEELARRKANLLKNPASGLPWGRRETKGARPVWPLNWFLRQKPNSNLLRTESRLYSIQNSN